MFEQYSTIIAADFEFEFGGNDGNLPRPVCMVAKDLRSGKEWRVWRGEFTATPPFPIDASNLFVAYYAQAELGCFRALGWPMPARILDLGVEFRHRVNGWTGDRSRILALNYFGLDGIGTHYKKDMIKLILTGGPWSAEERDEIIEYCAGDVYALERLLPAMASEIDLPRALLRGRYMAAVSAMERNGVPIDVETLTKLRAHWTDIQDKLIAAIDADYHVYDGRTFKIAWFEQFLIAHGIPWPLLESGSICLDKATFREMAKAHSIISPLRELRHVISDMRQISLTVGDGGRNRTGLWAFGSKTGRNQPSNSKFIFGPSVWLRGLIKPPPGHAIAYIDWASQEIAIAAALSGDEAMMEDYRTGDPYIAFGIRSGNLPAGAKRCDEHEPVRDVLKACVLGLQYGMAAFSLASRTGQPAIVARNLIRSHHERYPQFWAMVDSAVACVMQGNLIQTVFGWPIRLSVNTKERSIMNYPMQANGAEMMRLEHVPPELNRQDSHGVLDRRFYRH